jgi:AmmeMemoRadiSam system protein B
MFYPADSAKLAQMVDDYLQAADTAPTQPAPKAIIAPHAGYIYSGPVAASAYAALRERAAQITRVILLGPAHRVPFYGLAASSATHFATPLGQVPLDRNAIDQILTLPQVKVLDEAHALEHSLEVQLPFLQTILGEFSLVPLVVGDASPAQVSEVLEALWGGDETLIVISSDLSHYHDYATAQRLDKATSAAIEALAPERIHHENACGRNPVNGLLALAKQHGLHAHTVDLRNSGDTAGPRDQVVGYGAYLIQ